MNLNEVYFQRHCTRSSAVPALTLFRGFFGLHVMGAGKGIYPHSLEPNSKHNPASAGRRILFFLAVIKKWLEVIVVMCKYLLMDDRLYFHLLNSPHLN